jgi:hypothetical protein
MQEGSLVVPTDMLFETLDSFIIAGGAFIPEPPTKDSICTIKTMERILSKINGRIFIGIRVGEIKIMFRGEEAWFGINDWAEIQPPTPVVLEQLMPEEAFVTV